MKWYGTRIGSRRAPSGFTPKLSLNGRHRAPPPTPRAAVLRLIGLVGGAFGGLLGIGGGSAIAPLLLIFANLRPAQVSGTTLATVFLISAAGSVAYASLGDFNFQLAWPIAIGSIAGSIMGAMSARRLSTRLMVVMFLAILPYFAIKEFYPSFAAPEIGSSLASLALLGLGTGLLSGLLGLSGASLVVPSLVGFFLIDHHAAQGIAMGVAVADSLAGAVTHARRGNVNYPTLVYMAPPAIIAALIGAFLSHSLSSSVLRVLFGGFIVTVWLLMLIRMIGDWFRARTTQQVIGAVSVNGTHPRGLPVSKDQKASGSAVSPPITKCRE